ncbi:BlaI/MecI/CopY family transcriptional regulator [Caulobacter sp. SLTY]|uniref:BlaI/MecI/CopY family transcriptional regulator n=1 Tax=Caulobacter sp. SLTY TaxID=2683262 RepID=UPI00196B335B|nr:BlaI/MecI/CopY family transcriptional regulator [Caulobacter sp. SLTY]
MIQPPSDTELEVLKIFWRDGAASAREVQDALPGGLDWTASTTRTVLERMRAKGLLERRSVHGLAVYEAVQGKADVLGGVLRRVMRQVLEVEGPLPASAFAGSQILSAAELAELEALLNAEEELPK